MALTLAQLKEIADWVYNQPTPTNSYTSQNPMRKYYIAVSSEDSKIYKKDEGIVAIFSNRTLPYTDNNEVASITAKIPMNAQTPSGTTVGINWAGIGATIDVKTLIRNAGIFLGVKIAKNIDKVNPVVYDEMVNICRNFADDINRIPYYYCKDTHDGIKYLSFIPLDILVALAIYLNGMGLFLQNKQLFEPGFYPVIETPWFSNITLRDYLPSLSDWYGVQDKDSFFRNFKIFNNFDDSWDIVITGFMTAFDNQINYSDCIKLTYSFNSTQKQLTAKVIPMSCIFTGASSIGYRPYSFTNNIMSSCITNVKEDWYYNIFTITYNISTGEFTQYSNLVDHDKYDIINQSTSFTGYSNLNFNKLYKTYRKEYRYEDHRDALLVDGFLSLSNNVTYDSDVLKFTKLEFLHMWDEILYQVIKNTITDITDKDFIILCNGRKDNNQSTYILKVFKNVTSMSSSVLSNLSEGIAFGGRHGTLRVAEKLYDSSDWIYDRIIQKYTGYCNSNNIELRGTTYNFGMQTLIQTYEILASDYTITQLADVTTDQYIFVSPYINNTSHRFYACNLGEIVEFGEQESYAGFELDSTATYPAGVVDKTSFLSIYGSRIRPTLGNPLIIDGEISQDQINTTDWIECSISETPPASQDASEQWTLDDTTDKDREKISDDIEKSAEDDDSDDDENNDNGKDDATDSGEVEEIPVEYVPNTLIGSLRQYKMNVSEMMNFSAGLSALDFSDVVQALIYGNPINGVVNMVTTYDGLWNSTNSQDNTQVRVWNTALNNGDNPVTATLIIQPIKEIDLGTINLATNTEIQEFVHDNYTDLTNCEIGLYLPFVGIINIDIHDFYKKELTLKARIDSTTGTIIYNVYSEGSNFKHLIYTCSGNCQSKIPLKSEDMSQLLRNIGNATAGVGGAILGGFV